MQPVIAIQQGVVRLAQPALRLLLQPLALLTPGGQLPEAFLRLAHRVANQQKRLLRLALPPGEPSVAQQKQPHVDLAQRVGQSQVFPRRVRLLLQRRQMALQLLKHVQHPHEVLVRALQPSLGLLLARAEAADARRLLKDGAAVLAALAEDVVDAALADDGIALLAHAGVAEQVHDVLEAAGGAVHEVLAVAAAVDAAGDADLVKGGAELMVGVVKDEGDLAVVEGLSLLGAVEDDVGHVVAAQHLGALLAQHPAHGVSDVALAAAVGAHDARHVLRKDDLRTPGEGFKAIDLQSAQAHHASPRQALSAALAAACSAAFLLLPSPVATALPCTLTRAVKRRSWSGPLWSTIS